MRTWHFVLFLMVGVIVIAQEVKNPAAGDFTSSPTEHIIEQIQKPFVVRSVKGIITCCDEEPMPDVLFEIQGQGADGRIRRTTTNKEGRFKIADVPDGTYRFKTTLNGWQSVVGTIIVSGKAQRKETITLQILIGV